MLAASVLAYPAASVFIVPAEEHRQPFMRPPLSALGLPDKGRALHNETAFDLQELDHQTNEVRVCSALP
jgi:hypothetical protein